jgi:hypothetical protein
MSRRTRTAAAQPLNMGTAVRRDREEVVDEWAPDPDAPTRTIRRARAVWLPDALHAKRTISKHLHDAATRLMDSFELGICGAKDRNMVFVSRSGGPGGMAEAQLAAAGDYRKAMAAAGDLGPVLVWCVLGHGSLRGYAAGLGRSRDGAQRDLLEALDRLAKHWGMA